MSDDGLDLSELAQAVAEAAAEELRPRFQHVAARRKADGSLLTEADLAMQQRLIAVLRAACPDYPALGEEMPAAQQQALLAAGERGLWCLDPLDGTGNFAAGVPLFAVSLALVRGGRVVAGLVHDPVRPETFWARRGGGAWRDGRPLRIPAASGRLADATALVDFKRLPPALATALAVRPPYRSQRSFGSVALDWCWLAAGRCQLYLHGGQRLWDFGAGALVFAEAGGAGGVLADYRGDWEDVHDLQPRIGLGAASPRLLEDWRAWIGAALQGGDS